MTSNGAHWIDLSRRAAFESHRLIGWIYWDPVGIANYAALGVPDGLGYYVATRGATLGAAGDEVVTAAFFSIHPDFIALALGLCREHTTFEAAAAARDDAVARGLQEYVPEICEPLAEMADELWAAADELPVSGRTLFASARAWPRPDDPLLSAWLAVNAIREWRGDTHWAIQIAEDLSGTEAGILDGAWRDYPDDWLPRSRGADDEALAAGYARLAAKGFAEGQTVNAEGVAYRAALEDRLDRICALAWQHLGEEGTVRFIELVEPAGDRLVQRIDETAGDLWMPAGRIRPS